MLSPLPAVSWCSNSNIDKSWKFLGSRFFYLRSSFSLLKSEERQVPGAKFAVHEFQGLSGGFEPTKHEHSAGKLPGRLQSWYETSPQHTSVYSSIQDSQLSIIYPHDQHMDYARTPGARRIKWSTLFFHGGEIDSSVWRSENPIRPNDGIKVWSTSPSRVEPHPIYHLNRQLILA